MNTEVKPRLRPIDASPLTLQGKEYLLLQDRTGLAPLSYIPRAWAPIVALFDGSRNLSEIVGSYSLNGGQMLPIDFLEHIVAQMDEAYLLDSPRFAAYYQATVDEFEVSPVRLAAFAGKSFPAEPDELKDLLTSFFSEASKLNQQQSSFEPAALRGIMVPHIDFTRGGPVEALAYQQLLEQKFDVYVVLGIAHSGVRYPFCATAKDYDTPFGPARTDVAFVQALEDRVGERFTAEQFTHKNEHSIEFVAVFLQAMTSTKDSRIVPILCGGFHDDVRSGRSPSRNPDIAAFCVALREVVDEWEARGKRVGFIASVDLSHVGSRFGDDATITPQRLAAIEVADRDFLHCAELGSAEALHNHIARDANARNVDAHPALYTLLTAFPELRGQVLHYAQTFDDEANSLVSFASMALFAGYG